MKMKRSRSARRPLCALLCALLCLPALCAAPEVCAASALPEVSARAAVLVELQTGRVVGEKNADERLPMASTTKIMTALLLCETGELDREITATAEMVTVEGSSMGLQAGDRVHYRDLLYGMLLASGNDAANTAAIAMAGSLEAFAQRMNEKARALGMDGTHFVTPSGLDDAEHYTTARDLARLAVFALKNPDFAAAAGSSSARLEYGNPPYARTLSNHNRLLREYEGACGVKTGFTKKSGRCLVSAAKRGGKGLVAVTLNAPDDWNDHRRMLDYGFDRLETRRMPVPWELGSVPVAGGVGEARPDYAPPELSLLPEDFERLSVQILREPFVYAPVRAGDPIGAVIYRLDGVELARRTVTAAESVDIKPYAAARARPGFWDWLLRFAGMK